jgi:cyclopropane fatty-acyl-phospholipid synthase-like methyltransferase
MSSLPKLDAVISRLIRGKKILDIGCGLGKWGQIKSYETAARMVSMQKQF